MTSDSELRAEISAYLGEKRTKILDHLSQAEWEDFRSREINTKKSYFVKGSRPKLKKFEAYFLFLCAYAKPLYKKYLFEEYARILSAPITEDLNEDEIGIDRELVILHIHDVQMGVGNTTGFYTVTVLNKVANRNRQGNRTLVLSERDFPVFQNTDELVYIDLGGSSAVAQAAEIAEGMKKKAEQATQGSDSNKNSSIIGTIAQAFKKTDKNDFYN